MEELEPLLKRAQNGAKQQQVGTEAIGRDVSGFRGEVGCESILCEKNSPRGAQATKTTKCPKVLQNTRLRVHACCQKDLGVPTDFQKPFPKAHMTDPHD